MKNKKMWFAGLCFALFIVLSACGQSSNQNAGGPTGGAGGAGGTTGGETTESAEAQALYKQNCMSCHGTDLQGAGSFPNLQKVGSRLDHAQIADVISNGRGAMRAFKDVLTQDEITILADWLAQKK